MLYVDVIIGGVVALIFIILGFFPVIVAKRKVKEEPYYETYFILGLSLVFFGIIFMFTTGSFIGSIFLIASVIYLVIGLVNWAKWSDR